MTDRRVIGVYDNNTETVLMSIPEAISSDDVATAATGELRSHFPAWIRVQRAQVTATGDVRVYLHVVLSRALFSPRFWREMARNAGGGLRHWWKGDRP